MSNSKVILCWFGLKWRGLELIRNDDQNWIKDSERKSK